MFIFPEIDHFFNMAVEKGENKPLTLVELECNTIKMLFESRPRSNGMKFGISVGGLYLRDKMTHNSIMPVLLTPQNRVSCSPSLQIKSILQKLFFASERQECVASKKFIALV